MDNISHILVVSSEESFGGLVAYVLEAAGFVVKNVRNKKEMEYLLRSNVNNHFDLMIIHNDTRGMDTIDLLESIRNIGEYERTPVILQDKEWTLEIIEGAQKFNAVLLKDNVGKLPEIVGMLLRK